MASTPPSIPPDIASSSKPDFQGYWSTFFYALLTNLPNTFESFKQFGAPAIAEIAATLVELAIQITSEVGRRVGESVDEFEQHAGPEIMKAAAAGLSDYFNVPISPAQIDRSRSSTSRFQFSETLGRYVLESMFGAFAAPNGITPDVGKEGAERLLGFNIGTALEGWLGHVVGSTPLTKWIPNWADLDEIMSQALGLGRLTRRIMGPLLKTLVVDPYTWDLNRTFTPAIFSEGDLVRLLNRRLIDDAEYFEQMTWHGWDTNKANKYIALRSRLPEKEDVAKMLELGIITEERALAIYQGLGFTEDGAQAMVQVTVEDRIRTYNNALESLGRDMYRDRQIDQSELRVMLEEAGRSPREVETILGLATIERDRPRELPRGTIEEAFRKGLVSLARLREYYLEVGYSLDDEVILEELAVGDRNEVLAREAAAAEKAKTTEFRTVPQGMIEQAYISGAIGAGRLADYYRSRNYSPDDVGLLLDRAAARKAEADRRAEELLAKANAPDFRELPKATIEDAFIRGIIGESRLLAWYEANKLTPGDAQVALTLVRQRKQEREASLADELAAAKGPDYLAVPRAVMEEAYYRGIINAGRLEAYYQGRNYTPTEIPILLAVAAQKLAERKAAAAAKAAKASASPTP